MIVVIRLDLDRYDILTIAKLVRSEVITMTEAREAKSYKSMSEIYRLMWERQVEDRKSA